MARRRALWPSAAVVSQPHRARAVRNAVRWRLTPRGRGQSSLRTRAVAGWESAEGARLYETLAQSADEVT